MEKVIIDCDPGIDDMLALLYAIKSPELDVLLISTVAGNVDASKGLENVQKLSNIVDFNIPIVQGYKSDDWIGAEDTHGLNGIGNYYLPTGYPNVIHEYADSAIWNTVKENPGEVTMICLGPLTNLCTVIVKYPHFMDLVKEVVIMGGCFEYSGNCSPVTEYNFWADPYSAQCVFEKFQYCNKLRVVGLECTHSFILTEDRLNHLKTIAPNTIYGFVKGITEYYIQFHKMQENIDGCVINDPVVIHAVINPSFLTYCNYYVKIVGETHNKDIRGQMLVDRKHFYHHLPNARVAIYAGLSDVEDFWDGFINTISKLPL
jgi:purine nucleosidase